jgi:hypothetical protein
MAVGSNQGRLTERDRLSTVELLKVVLMRLGI